jgi:tuberous sclerosis 2
MYDLSLLTPTSPEWLDNITTLFVALLGRERPASSREVANVIKLVHSDLMGVPVYRRQLGRRVSELAEWPGQDDQAGVGMDGDEYLFATCTNELVWRMIESGQDEGGEEDDVPREELGNEDWAEHIIQLFVRHAEGICPCSLDVTADDNPIPSSPLQQQESTSGAPQAPQSSGTTPVLSRVPSDFNMLDDDSVLATPTASGSSSALMYILPGWSMPRSREPEAPSPVTNRSEPEGPVFHTCRPLIASISLVNAFLDVSFSAPPLAAQSVRLFKTIISVLAGAKCTRAKLTILQLLMRLRADRDHRLYILDNIDNDIQALAVLLDRSQLATRETPSEEVELQRARSVSRGLRRGRPKSTPGSRSRSRPVPPLLTVPSPATHRGPLWMVPESVPFTVSHSQPSSDGITTYEVNAPSEWEDLKHWLPVSDYVFTLVDILKSETDWDILSYVLCHLPVQLANKHFFCGPKTKDAIVALLTTLCTVTFKGESAHIIAEQMPESLRLRDAQGVVYHTLTVLISYRGIFDERKHHDMLVEAFLAGLSSQPSTVKSCLNALSICAFELPTSITKNLSHILEKLSRIMTNAAMAVHILDFLSIVGSLPSLYANFREQEFRLVFAVAVAYIHHHNSPDTRGLSGRESFALSQHVLVIAYYIIYVWFLAVALPDRPNHVEFLTRRLLLANEAKGAVDEPTEVCFDWLARYAYATADPKPAYSLLGDIVMNPPRDENNALVETPTSSKTWIWGNSLVSIRTLPKRGWIEVESVRPSGETRFLCKLENFPQVNPGDVDPDRLTDPSIMMADRAPAEIERKMTDLEADEQAMNAPVSPWVSVPCR